MSTPPQSKCVAVVCRMTCGLIAFLASDGPLPDEPHGARPIRSNVEILDGDGRSLAGACSRVVEKQQDAVITTALLGCAIRRIRGARADPFRTGSPRLFKVDLSGSRKPPLNPAASLRTYASSHQRSVQLGAPFVGILARLGADGVDLPEAGRGCVSIGGNPRLELAPRRR
jgi:hypothetical protein